MHRNATAPVIALSLALSLGIAAPGAAETGRNGYAEGWGRLSEGARLLLDNLLSDLMPMVEDLRGLVDDARLYHPPEVLPNGDIIIRRRRPPDDAAPAEDDEGPREL